MSKHAFSAQCDECPARVIVRARRTKGAIRRCHGRGWLVILGPTRVILCQKCLARRVVCLPLSSSSLGSTEKANTRKGNLK